VSNITAMSLSPIIGLAVLVGGCTESFLEPSTIPTVWEAQSIGGVPLPVTDSTTFGDFVSIVDTVRLYPPDRFEYITISDVVDRRSGDTTRLRDIALGTYDLTFFGLKFTFGCPDHCGSLTGRFVPPDVLLFRGLEFKAVSGP